MPTASQTIEYTLTAAFVAAMKKHSGIAAKVAAAQIRGWADVSTSLGYPCILVHCQPADDEPFNPLGGHARALVEIQARSTKDDDKSGTAVDLILGAVRDFLHTGLAAALENEATIQIYTAAVEPPGHSSDEFGIRTRGVTVRVGCSLILDLPT